MRSFLRQQRPDIFLASASAAAATVAVASLNGKVLHDGNHNEDYYQDRTSSAQQPQQQQQYSSRSAWKSNTSHYGTGLKEQLRHTFNASSLFVSPNIAHCLATTTTKSSESSSSSFSRPTRKDGDDDEDAKMAASNQQVQAPVPSTVRRWLATLHIKSLPLPRRVVKGDNVFQDSTLQKGLRQRKRDEYKLQCLQKEAMEARQSGNPDQINAVFSKASEIAYGKGITPQQREDFLIQYGCTGWTQDVLDYVLLAPSSSSSSIGGLGGSQRGIIEIGAGHGQWALALTNHHEKLVSPNTTIQNKKKEFEVVLAFDDMTQLPLNTQVYHKHTQSAHDYFYKNVRELKKEDSDTIFRKWSCRGRILLLVYPSPGPMALTTIQNYIHAWPDDNDTIVYVGEGRGGANGNEDLFDFLENGDWILLNVMNVEPSPGGKGFEKLYVLRRRRPQADQQDDHSS